MKTEPQYDPDCIEATQALWKELTKHALRPSDATPIIAAALKEYACEADKRITESEWAQKYKEACIDIATLHEAVEEYVAASMVNVPASRVQDAWEKLKAIAAPSNTKLTHPADGERGA